MRGPFAAVRESACGIVSRVTPVHTALRNCTRDEGGPFEVGDQVLISSHRKLLSSKPLLTCRSQIPRPPPVFAPTRHATATLLADNRGDGIVVFPSGSGVVTC